MRELARLYEVNRCTITRLVHRTGHAVIGPRKKLSSEREAELVSRYLKGERPRTLAGLYGVDPVTIVRMVRQAGHGEAVRPWGKVWKP